MCSFLNGNKVRMKIYINSSLLCRTDFLCFLQRVWMADCLAQLEHRKFWQMATVFSSAHSQNSESKTDLPQSLKGIMTNLKSRQFTAWSAYGFKSAYTWKPCDLVSYFLFFSKASVSFAYCCIRGPLRMEEFAWMATHKKKDYAQNVFKRRQ